MPRGSVLVVEDDPDIAGLVRLHLSDAGYRVTIAADGQVGWNELCARHHDLVVLDLTLPGLDGLEICRRLAMNDRHPSILMLTARSAESERVRGLDLGADDYLSKPFSVIELVARVRALLRRLQSLDRAADGVDAGTLVRGPLQVDRAQRKVVLQEREIALTSREFDLLAWLARHPGRVFSRAELLDTVWGYDCDSLEHTVNSHLNRLRNKLEDDPARPRYIVTVRGAGYKFVLPDGA
ncbi:MAG: response regulator transcription factor [Steroidobacteraceae bacterium]